MARLRQRLVLAAAAVLVAGAAAGGAAEVYLRSRETTPPLTWGWKDPLGLLPAAETNELGYRGQKIAYTPDDFVVVLLGDSQAQGCGCSFAAMPERRLEPALAAALQRRVKVFTLGALGYSTDQELVALEEYFGRYRADLVVCWLTPGNDVRDLLFPTMVLPKPTFWLDAAGALRGPTGRFGEPVYSRCRLWARLQRWLEGNPDLWWHEHRLPPPYRPLTAHHGPVRTDWGVVNLAAESVALERLQVIVQLDPPSPRARYAMRLTNAILHRMREVTEAQGGRFRPFLDDRRDFPLADGVYAADLDGGRHLLRLSTRAYDENIAAMVAGLDLVRVPVTTPHWVVGPADPHLNEGAVAQVMRDLASALAKR